MAELQTELPTLWEQYIERLSEYMKSSGKEYKNHAATIRCWANADKKKENPPDLAQARIYDRILEWCAPVLFSGKNFREERARATKAAAKEIVRKDNKV